MAVWVFVSKLEPPLFGVGRTIFGVGRTSANCCNTALIKVCVYHTQYMNNTKQILRRVLARFFTTFDLLNQ